MATGLKVEVEKNTVAAWYIAASLISVSLFVLFGWLFNVRTLTTVNPEWVTMKFSTAFAFFICGLIVIFRERKLVSMFLSGMVASVIFSTLVAFFFGFATSGFLPQFESDTAVYTAFPDFPSWPTLACFVMISIFGFISNRWQILLAKSVVCLSSIAILGYLINMQILYYYIPGISTAMAFHTAALMLHMGMFQLSQARKVALIKK